PLALRQNDMRHAVDLDHDSLQTTSRYLSRSKFCISVPSYGEGLASCTPTDGANEGGCAAPLISREAPLSEFQTRGDTLSNDPFDLFFCVPRGNVVFVRHKTSDTKCALTSAPPCVG